MRQIYSGSVHEAESCWCDVSRWPAWVDGLARVISVDPSWPAMGAEVVWESGPAGRGRVTERVEAFEPLAGLTLAVEDDSIHGRQRVSFDPAGAGVEVELALEYRIKRRWLLTPLIDRLFVRGPMTTSLTKTLERFGTVLPASRGRGLG